jgi:hypothetical protein
MDELQISGKRYISSRRIAKENGYHTDYIGQLIRGGKIKGQKVGRTWYVEEASFAAYLGQPESALSTQRSDSGYVDSPASESTEVAAPQPLVTSTQTAPGYIPSAPLVESTQKMIVQAQPIAPKPLAHAKEEETVSIPLRKIEHAPLAVGGLRYVAEESSLPEIGRSEAITRTMPSAPVAVPESHAPIAVLPHRHINAKRMFALVGVASIAIFIFSMIVSSGLFQTISIQAGNPASVGYTLHW